MKILSIETSCDETAVCIVEASGGLESPTFTVLGNALFSQVELHKEFGGVFPTLAKREHARNLIPLLEKVLKESNLISNFQFPISKQNFENKEEEISKILEKEKGLFESFKNFLENKDKPEIDLISVTSGPGLEPALWVGIVFAQALGKLWNIPVLGICFGHQFLARMYGTENVRVAKVPEIGWLKIDILESDSLLGEKLQKYLEEEGISIYTKAKTKKIKKTKDGVELAAEIDGRRKNLKAEKLMIATGLQPHTKLLETEKAGIELDERGFVKVNDYMQTSQKHIYAAGDVTGLIPLETIAAKQGNFAIFNMFENANKTEEEYMKEHNVCLCRTITLDHVEKAAAIKDTRGLIRMVVEPETKVIIGVHIIGPMAADIITTAAYAIKNKMTIYDIRDTVHVCK